MNLIHEQAETHNKDYRQKIKERAEKNPKIKLLPMALEVQVSVFSDNIIISKPASFGGRILNVGQLCVRLLERGFLTRGGIARGKLHHDDNLVFGPALNRSVAIEKVTGQPRIEIDESIVSIFREDLKEDFDTFVKRDREGKYIVNLFAIPLRYDGDDAEEFFEGFVKENWDMSTIMKNIQANKEKFKAGDKELKKWEYMHENIASLFFEDKPYLIKPYL